MAPFLPTVYLMWEKMPANKRSQAWDTGLNLATSSAGDPLWQWLSLSGHCPAPLHPQGSTWTEHIHVSPPLCRAVGPLQELFAQDNERGQHPVGLQRARGAQGALHPEKPQWRHIPHLASGSPSPQKLLLAPPDLLISVFISYLFICYD